MSFLWISDVHMKRNVDLNHLRPFKLLDKLVTIIFVSLQSFGVSTVLMCWLFYQLPIYYTNVLPQYSLLRLAYIVTCSYHALSTSLMYSLITCHFISIFPMFLILMRRELTP